MSSEMIYRCWIPPIHQATLLGPSQRPPLESMAKNTKNKMKPHIGTHLDVFNTKEGWDEVLPDCPISSLWDSI